MGNARRTCARVAPALLLVLVLASVSACEEVQGKLGEARQTAESEWQLVREQAGARREELEARLREQLGELQPQLDALRDSARALSEGPRTEVERWIRSLEERREGASKLLEDLRGAGEQTLDRLLREAEAEATALAETLRRLRREQEPTEGGAVR